MKMPLLIKQYVALKEKAAFWQILFETSQAFLTIFLSYFKISFEQMSSKYSVEISIPFLNENHAMIAMRSLSVDKDPKNSNVIKTWNVNENTLNVTIHSDSLKLLRTVSSSFYEMILPVVETLKEFSD